MKKPAIAKFLLGSFLVPSMLSGITNVKAEGDKQTSSQSTQTQGAAKRLEPVYLSNVAYYMPNIKDKMKLVKTCKNGKAALEILPVIDLTKLDLHEENCMYKLVDHIAMNPNAQTIELSYENLEVLRTNQGIRKAFGNIIKTLNSGNGPYLRVTDIPLFSERSFDGANSIRDYISGFDGRIVSFNKYSFRNDLMSMKNPRTIRCIQVDKNEDALELIHNYQDDLNLINSNDHSAISLKLRNGGVGLTAAILNEMSNSNRKVVIIGVGFSPDRINYFMNPNIIFERMEVTDELINTLNAMTEHDLKKFRFPSEVRFDFLEHEKEASSYLGSFVKLISEKTFARLPNVITIWCKYPLGPDCANYLTALQQKGITIKFGPQGINKLNKQ